MPQDNRTDYTIEVVMHTKSFSQALLGKQSIVILPAPKRILQKCYAPPPKALRADVTTVETADSQLLKWLKQAGQTGLLYLLDAVHGNAFKHWSTHPWQLCMLSAGTAYHPNPWLHTGFPIGGNVLEKLLGA